MKVLFVLDIYPHSTETYVESEIRGAVAAGAAVEVWSADSRSDFPHPVIVPLHDDQELAACITRVRPDLVYTYFLNNAERMLPEIAPSGLPHVVRAHSYDFDHARLARVVAHPAVDRVLVFPHMADEVETAGRAKLVKLPVMYDPAYYPGRGIAKDRRLVLRVASSLDTKRLAQFFAAAQACPDHRFVLILGQGYDFNRTALAALQALNARQPRPVEILVNLDWPAVSDWMRRAAIYLYTPPTHYPGMPISIAEAMASGCLVVAPDIAGMGDYVGAAGGLLYRSPEEAAAIIRDTAAWTDAGWDAVGARAAAVAQSSYANTVVAPRLVEIWRDAVATHVAPLGFWRRLMARKRARAVVAA